MKRILLFLLLAGNLCSAQVDLNLGLRAYYPFSGNANDVSGNNNNPVFNNATLTADRFGNPNSAYHFNGTSSYMKINNSTSINVATNKLSLVAWVRPMGFYSGTCHGNAVIMKGDADYLSGNYLMRFDDGAYLSYTNCSVPVDVLHQNFYGDNMRPPVPGYTPYIQTNQWYSVIITYDGTTAKLYENCELKASIAQTNLTFTNIYDLYFGRLNSGSFPYWFNGDMDEVRIYDRALNVDEVNVLGGCATPVSCNNWLRTQAIGQSVTVGDLDISGNQITIEANFNCTSFPISGLNKWEDIVSKHANTTDANYVLRMDLAAITTTTGHYLLSPACDNLAVNKTFHVALVYDGTNLKFYRNGFLMGQMAVTGNLILNNWMTTIGDYAVNNPVGTNFFGYINEVKIWNVARTQAQLQAYMNTSLPSPTTQPGLLGYYTFDNLLNKQGNAAYNGTLNGGATINNANPDCSFVADSCLVSTSISNIINDYTPVLALNPCNNKLTVEDGTKYNAGDTVLLIQMKGAVIDSTNTSTFGTITDYKNSGNYEFNYVKSKSGNIIELKNNLIRQYDIPVGKVQLIRVPYYSSANITGTLTCLPWDGNKGGVLVLQARDTVTLNANIDVSGKGFRGGKALNSGIFDFLPYCGTQTYFSPSTATAKQEKGEGIAEVSALKISGRGPLANGGGGGNLINSGGGGGSNGTAGGKGGDQYQDCINTPNDIGGLGGKVLSYSSALNKIYLGGGGGAGDANDSNPPPFNPDGGNGGGIIIIKSNYFQANSRSIISNGDNGKFCPANCKEGMGGGGAGGTILLDITNYMAANNLVVSKGGKGENNTPHNVTLNHGPGGGGSGGIIFIRSATLPAAITPDLSGGQNGISQNTPPVNWGAQPGNSGQTVFNLQLPFTTTPFVPNIDSVRIKDSLLVCFAFDFKGLAYFNTNPIATWQWYFGDGGSANSQNTSHAYASAGTYTVKLIVADINGCMDSTSINVNAVAGVSAYAGSDTSICSSGTVSVMLNGTAVGGPYSWTPAALLDNPNIQNPVATISSTTTFYLSVTGAASCTSLDSVTVYINPLPLVNTIADTAICKFTSLVLNTTSNANSYQWSPAVYVNNPTIANPNFIDTVSRKLYVTGTSLAGCTATDSVDITVNPLPVVQTIDDTTLCSSQTLVLNTTGAQTYSWSPATWLSDPTVAGPVFSGSTNQSYIVTGTDVNGCRNTDMVNIFFSTPDSLKQPPSFSICGTQSVQLDGNNGNRVSYLWSPATYLSSNNIINPWANPPQTTLYTLVVTDNTCGFDSTFTTLLTISPAPVVNAGKSNDIDCANRSAVLQASGGSQYTWSPSTGLSSTTIANPVATPATTQTYTVQVVNSGGCTNTDSVTVVVGSTASLARYMPNAFTPNGDGLNDCYGLKNWMYVKQLQFFIFNRYGEQVFGTANPNKCWDGTYKGKPALAGTYVYVIRANTECGTEEQKGNFILIR